MEYITQEHLDHIRKNGFNPKICHECQQIELILMKQIEYVPDLYEALKAMTSQFKRVYPLYSKDIEIIHQAQQALAKVENEVQNKVQS